MLMLATITDVEVNVFSNGDVTGKHTFFELKTLSPAQAVAYLISRGWSSCPLGNVVPITYVCRKES